MSVATSDHLIQWIFSFACGFMLWEVIKSGLALYVFLKHGPQPEVDS
jgi:hypothetical protein